MSETLKQMEDEMKWRHVLAFGDWDLWDDRAFTQCFDSVRRVGSICEIADLFAVPECVKPARQHHRKMSKKRPSAPKAVDEDLYKIPEELLCQKPCRKRLLRGFLSGCVGLNCIA